MKIQVLELPTRYVGEYSETPYALVFSEVPEEEVPKVVQSLNGLSDLEGGPTFLLATDETVEL